MKKEYVTISDVVKTTTLATFFMAGITFTLFLNDNSENVNSSNFLFEQSVKNEGIEVQELTSGDNITFTVLSNEPTTSEKIDYAYDSFCSKYGTNDDLGKVCEFIKNGIGDVKSDDVAIDANIQDGFLNVSLRLNDGAILSINKCFDSMDNSMVAFNIFKSRKLLVSDIMEINTLSTYIHNVQNRLS